MQSLRFTGKGVLLVLWILLPFFGSAQSAYDYYQKAYTAFKDKDFQTGIYYAKKSLEVDRYYYYAYGLLGDCYFNLEDYNNAVINYTEALKNNSFSSSSLAYYYLSRADAREKLGDFDGAIADYTSCIGKYVSEYSGSAYWSRGVIYANKKKDDEAAKRDYESAIPYYSSDKKSLCILYGNISDCELSAGNYELALEKANKSIEYDPESSVGYKRQGYAYKAQKKYALAKVSFSKALKLIKDNNQEMANIYRNIGVCQYELFEYDEAIINLEQALQLKPNYKEVYWDLAYVYYEKDMYDKAASLYSKAISYYLDDTKSLFSLYRWRGNSYHALQDYDKAKKDYNTAMTYAEKDDKALLHSDISLSQFYSGNITAALVWINKALALQEKESFQLSKVRYLAAKKSFKETLPVLDALIDKNPDDWYYFYKRGLYNWRTNNKIAATKDFEQFNTLSEGKNIYGVYPVVYLLFKGQKQEAIKKMKDQINKDPQNSPQELYDLACLYALAGNTEDALKTLEASLKAGYKNTRWIQLDDDLQSVQSLPAFAALLKKYKITPMVKK